MPHVFHARLKRMELVSLRHRFGGRCFYCDRLTVLPKLRRGARQPRVAATRDHILPQGLGGTDEPGNIILACFECNQLRGMTPADVFLVQRQRAERISP